MDYFCCYYGCINLFFTHWGPMSSNRTGCQSSKKHPFPLSVHHLFNLESEYIYLTGYLHSASSLENIQFSAFLISFLSILISLVWVGNPKQNWGETMGFIHWNIASQVTWMAKTEGDLEWELSQAAKGGSRDLGWKPGSRVQGPLFQCSWLDLTILVQEGL